MGEFIKHDDSKLMFSLIEPEFLEGMASVLTKGAAKYEIGNWKRLDPKEVRRYKDALLRHINESMKGNLLDGETHESHLLHSACNLMFLYHFEKRGHNELDR